jgi:hypothetical protein
MEMKVNNVKDFYDLILFLQNNEFEAICPTVLREVGAPFVTYRMSNDDMTMLVSLFEEGATVTVDGNTSDEHSGTGMLSFKEAFKIVLDYFYPEKVFETIVIEPKEPDKSIILDKESSEPVGYIKHNDNYSVVKFKRENEFYTCIKTFEGVDIEEYLEAVDKANAYFNAQMIVGSDKDIDKECEGKCSSTYKGDLYEVKEEDLENFFKALMGYIK